MIPKYGNLKVEVADFEAHANIYNGNPLGQKTYDYLVLRQDKNFNLIRDLLSHLIVAPQSYPDGHRDRLYSFEAA